jgi:hypothetical protein
MKSQRDSRNITQFFFQPRRQIGVGSQLNNPADLPSGKSPDTSSKTEICSENSDYSTRLPSINEQRRSHWSRGLRRRSTAARLLRSWVRIPPGVWMFVCCVCLCCQVEVSAMSWSLVQMNPTECGASLCVIKKPRGREGHSPRWAAEPENKKKLRMNSKLRET